MHPDGKLHHGRCPRLLAALEYAEQQQQQQQQQLQVAISGNGGSMIIDSPTIASPLQAVAMTVPITAGNSGSGNLGIAPRASPEISEADTSANACRRLSLHRASSVSCNGNDNVVGNVAEASSPDVLRTVETGDAIY